MTHSIMYRSPLGIIKIRFSGGYINELLYVNNDDANTNHDTELSSNEEELLQTCISQFDEYFEGKRKIFDFPMEQEGTVFQKKVWSELIKIPYGETISYLKLAQRLGDVKSIRAAASANGKNKLNIVVPCHRVIGSDGSLTGYGGGLPKKKWLLDHENKYANGVSLLF